MRLETFAAEADWIASVKREFEAVMALRRTAGRNRPLHLCLAGGSTPGPIYRAMAALPLRGLPIEIWLGDERAVSRTDPAWNGAIVAAAFSPCEWDPPPHIRFWPAIEQGGDEAEARAACVLYAAELAAVFGQRPAFDLALLGLGGDGHTASLFPGQPILSERVSLAATSLAPTAPRFRMSLTYPALSGARRVRFLARGSEKLPIVRRLAADEDVPAARIQAADTAILYCKV